MTKLGSKFGAGSTGTLGLGNDEKPPPARIMVVSHPDDEALWGWECLEEEEDWLVICVTTGSNLSRKSAFLQVAKVFGFQAEIWDFPNRQLDNNERQILADRIGPIINSPGVKKIVTHGEHGEYGNPFHRQLFEIVHESLLSKTMLHTFGFAFFGGSTDHSWSPKARKAFQLYFPGLHSNGRLMSLSESINSQFGVFRVPGRVKRKIGSVLLKAGKAVLWRSRSQQGFESAMKSWLWTTNAPWDASDRIHLELAKHTNITEYSLAKRKPSEPRNFVEAFMAGPEVYHSNPARAYLNLEFLPSCIGKTLGVGVHSFNTHDAHCLPNPEDYRTVDLAASYAGFGSPFGHDTVDFLNYDPGYKFQHIVLFGVLGIPTDAKRDSDSYPLHNRVSDTLRHADKLLSIGGRLLIGADIWITGGSKRKRKENKMYWGDLYDTEEILSHNFILTNKFSSRQQMVLVLEKIR